jgi:3-isopropylmalate/(R)-2-methylmalate dehydratase small subunit
VPLDRANVDTDQIVPKQFLKRLGRTGFGEVLFFDWRYRADGTPDPRFELNRAEYDGASVLVAGRNFGCGSSREHAAWAIREFGIRAIMAPSFADIFRNNCLRNGLAPVVVSDEVCASVMQRALRGDGYTVTVDVEACAVTDGEALDERFEMDAFWRRCLLEGSDEIELALRSEADIRAYEARRPTWMPVLVEGLVQVA